MDVLFSPDLRAPVWEWEWVGMVPVTRRGTEGAAWFEVPKSAVSEEMQIPPSFAHDEFCIPSTNAVISPLDDETCYTNVVCACVREKSPGGFFRLSIPDPSLNIPAWWRVLYGFAPYDSWEDEVDFNMDGFSNMDEYMEGRNPVAPPANANAFTIQYVYDDDDRLKASFIGTGANATLRHLSPAGNPIIQHEKSAQ